MTKVYHDTPVVDHVSFVVEDGEIFGLLGPNGAGKTTLMKLLLGLVRPTAGSARVLGHNLPSGPEVLTRIGGIIEAPAFYPWMSAYESLRVQALTCGRRPSRAQLEQLLVDVGLEGVGPKPTKAFSQGMRQRLALARALVCEPRLLIVDEPTNGLDPEGIAWLRTFLQEQAQNGTAILVSSHQLNEVEKLCHSVGVMLEGRLVEIGNTTSVGSAIEAGFPKVRVRFANPEELRKARALLKKAETIDDSDLDLVLTGLRGREVAELLAKGGVFPEELSEEAPTLEKRFLEITGVIRHLE